MWTNAQPSLGKREPNFLAMARTAFLGNRALLSGKFTLAGKCRSKPRPGWARVGRAMLLLLASVDAASAARLEAGPTSSATIGISLSVAPKYGPKASAPGIHGSVLSRRICLATNGRKTFLPVLLVQVGTGENYSGRGRERIGELGWCGSGYNLIEAGKAAGPLIVRPE